MKVIKIYDDLDKATKKIAFENYIAEFDPYNMSDNVLCKVSKKNIEQAIRENKIKFTEEGKII